MIKKDELRNSDRKLFDLEKNYKKSLAKASRSIV